jgi:hypothetical protein
VVAFPPPPVTFPATRLTFCLRFTVSDFCSSPRWFLAEKCFPFLSGKLWKQFFNYLLEPSLSASIQGVNSNFFPSFVTLKRCVTAPLASPCTGRKPVSIFDCIWSLRSFFFMSSRKYFRFYEFFTLILSQVVENFFACLWKKLWKNRQAS